MAAYRSLAHKRPIPPPEPRTAESLPKNHRLTVHATAKLDGNFWVRESEKQGLVAFTRYWIAPAYIAQPLLEWWNLPLEAGTYEVTQRVRRSPVDAMTPEVDKLLPRVKSGEAMRPAKLRSMGMRVFSDGEQHALLNPGEVIIRTAYLDTIVPGWEDNDDLTFHTTGELRPVHLWDGDAFAGVVMPVRVR